MWPHNAAVEFGYQFTLGSATWKVCYSSVRTVGQVLERLETEQSVPTSMMSLTIGTHRDSSYIEVRSFLAGFVPFLAPDCSNKKDKRQQIYLDFHSHKEAQRNEITS